MKTFENAIKTITNSNTYKYALLNNIDVFPLHVRGVVCNSASVLGLMFLELLLRSPMKVGHPAETFDDSINKKS